MYRVLLDSQPSGTMWHIGHLRDISALYLVLQTAA